jgi:hypothetical protein
MVAEQANQDNSRLAEDIFSAKRLADPRALLRVTPYGQEAGELPTRAQSWVGPGTGPGKIILRTVIIIAITVAGVYLSTVQAWDHENFFPRYWNIVWLVFPWFFLLPLWTSFIKSLTKKPADDHFRAQYARVRDSLDSVTGTVVDTWMARGESGGIVDFVLAVEHPGMSHPMVAHRLAADAVFQPFEAPVHGDKVHLWQFPDGWTLIQATRPRARGQSSPERPSNASLPEQLERLARLRESGALSAEEFKKAKLQLLDEE